MICKILLHFFICSFLLQLWTINNSALVTTCIMWNICVSYRRQVNASKWWGHFYFCVRTPISFSSELLSTHSLSHLYLCFGLSQLSWRILHSALLNIVRCDLVRLDVIPSLQSASFTPQLGVVSKLRVHWIPLSTSLTKMSNSIGPISLKNALRTC